MPYWSKRGASGPEKRKLVHAGPPRKKKDTLTALIKCSIAHKLFTFLQSSAQYKLHSTLNHYIDVDCLSENIAARTASDGWNGQGIWTTLSAKPPINVVHETQVGTQRNRTSMPCTRRK
jgi:hypothetical protein